jgi:pimeloyl-ACP methyl ester carboxylesterase
MPGINSRTIVFITGAFVSHRCWDDWKTFFERRGYKIVVPAWPGKDADPEVLRSSHPSGDIAKVTMNELIDHYGQIIEDLPEEPVLIGHSLGGLLVQVLLNNGLGAAGIAIHSVPPLGVMPFELSFYKSNLSAFGFFSDINKTYLISFRKWQYAFTNGMSFEEQKKAYEDLAIPESKRAIRGALTSAAKVDFKAEHNPLLIVAGNSDQCIPASLNERNFKKYKSKSSVTQFVVREGRNHFVLGQPTWKEDAQFILDWIQKH